MAFSEEPLSIVEQWKKKSYEMSSLSNDSIVLLLARGIDTMAVVVNKKLDLDRVERALVSLESERSISLQFDKIKNDDVRSLVYGLIESLHFTLSELTKERTQVKECGEVFTQTEEIPNRFETPFDESLLKIEDYWGDETAIKDEDMPNDDMDTQNVDGDIAGDIRDVSSIMDGDDTTQFVVPVLNHVRDEPHFENEDVDETVNSSNATEIIQENREKDSSKPVEVDKKRRPSRNVSKPEKFADCESQNYSDDKESEPLMKKSKAEISKMEIRNSSFIEKKSGSSRSKEKSREMKCTECEYQTTSAGAFLNHLRYVHSTNPGLAGLALLCDCGVEVRSESHGRKCDIANFTVVRKRDGPIQTFNDEKKTPQCIICKVYPKTAMGYTQHLKLHHKSTLIRQGIWLLCKCGAKYRHDHHDSNHTKECTRREFTLHKVADK